MTLKGGYGIGAYGRCNYGQALSKYEPRFWESDPADAATQVSEEQTIIWFTLYCFSSWLREEQDLKIEISENGGSSYSNAFITGSYVYPYDERHSKILRLDGQTMKIFIHKKFAWEDDKEIRIRVTAEDIHGNTATKVTPIRWN